MRNVSTDINKDNVDIEIISLGFWDSSGKIEIVKD